MSRDLRGLMRDSAVRPGRDLDLDALWRRGRRRRRARRLGASAAGLVVLAGLAVLVVPGVRSVPPVVGDPPPGEPLRVVRTVDVPEPGPLTAAAGRVWVTTYQGALRWIEPETGRTGPGPVGSAACGLGGGADLVVVFRCVDPAQPDGELVAVDPATATVRWRTPVDGYVTAVAQTGERVVVLAQAGRDAWLATLDAASGVELHRIPFERASAWDVVADGARAWATMTRQPAATSPARTTELVAVDLATGAVADRAVLGDDRGGPQRLALAGSEIWLPSTGEDAVLVLSSATLAEVGRVPGSLPASDPSAAPALVASADRVWIVTAADVRAVERSGRSVSAALALGRIRVTQRPAVSDGQLWVSDRDGDRVVAVGW